MNTQPTPHQPTPWHLSDLGVPEIYDAAGDLVCVLGNDFNGISGDLANARLVVEAVNAHTAKEASDD